MPGSLAFVLKGYPRLSETFIAQEIKAIEDGGVDLTIVSLRQPSEARVHPIHRDIHAPVHYLPEYLYRAPVRVFKAWLRMRSARGYRRAVQVWLGDLRRDPSPSRGRRFGQALVLAAELGAELKHLHAHFIHTPGSVTRYASMLLGIPWSCSAHAKDIWTIPEWEKREKLAHCSWASTCTAVNQRHLAALAPDGERVELIYHGLDFSRFPPPGAEHSLRDGSDPLDPVRILCVGRAVEKKGIDDLLRALAGLPADCHWRLAHAGNGPLLKRLRRSAGKLGLGSRITWHGAMDQEQIIRLYAASDVFVLPCRVAADGDRDGLPNVLMEAQSQDLACISTRVSAVPELIEHEVTGLLVPERDPVALCGALHRLVSEPRLRIRLGTAGGRRVRREFSFARGAHRLRERFEESLAG